MIEHREDTPGVYEDRQGNLHNTQNRKLILTIPYLFRFFGEIWRDFYYKRDQAAKFLYLWFKDEIKSAWKEYEGRRKGQKKEEKEAEEINLSLKKIALNLEKLFTDEEHFHEICSKQELTETATSRLLRQLQVDFKDSYKQITRIYVYERNVYESDVSILLRNNIILKNSGNFSQNDKNNSVGDNEGDNSVGNNEGDNEGDNSVENNEGNHSEKRIRNKVRKNTYQEK